MHSIEEIDSNKRIKEIYKILISNLLPIIIITLTGIAISVVYALTSENIYESETSIKFSRKQGNILETPWLGGNFYDYGNDRFIANEMEIMKSRTTRMKVTEALIDTFKRDPEKEKYKRLMLEYESNGSNKELKSKEVIIKMLLSAKIEQVRGLDIVKLSFSSASAEEAAIITNTYAEIYEYINLDFNRRQLINVREFLDDQKEEKFKELKEAENRLISFQESGSIISLDNQAVNLIERISDFESKKDLANIELTAAEKSLSAYREELKNRSPELDLYVNKFTQEPVIEQMLSEIAKLEARRDLVLANADDAENVKETIDETNIKIEKLKQNLDEKIRQYRNNIVAATPEEIKNITLQIFRLEVEKSKNTAILNELDDIINTYEEKFELLPERAITLAGLQRERESKEKLYLLLEEKYQEALINEQSTPGNLQIIDRAYPTVIPAKPNRKLIIFAGFVLGFGMGIMFAFVKEYLDNTVKTPEDISERGIPVLGWIPKIKGLNADESKQYEFIVQSKPDSVPAEAFRALRTRISFSKLDEKGISNILITSSAPREGKTLISINFAGSFAQTNKKTVILDADLRKPRLHQVFEMNRYPGFTDYIFGRQSFEEIVRKTELSHLDFIPAGTIPPNPSEILASKQMKDFISMLNDKYDFIIIDSPPILAVTDSEILSRLVDATILVVSSQITEKDLMEKAVELLRHETGSFAGTVLNNFDYKTGYGSYYKYYYYYSRNEK